VADVSVIDWHVHLARADRWRAAWEPAAERALSFGARRWSLTRSVEDPLHFRQEIVWERREDFDTYWYSDEVSAVREEIMNLYNKPLAIHWFTLAADGGEAREESRPEPARTPEEAQT
jgi:hypothetical protein